MVSRKLKLGSTPSADFLCLIHLEAMPLFNRSRISAAARLNPTRKSRPGDLQSPISIKGDLNVQVFHTAFIFDDLLRWAFCSGLLGLRLR